MLMITDWHPSLAISRVMCHVNRILKMKSASSTNSNIAAFFSVFISFVFIPLLVWLMKSCSVGIFRLESTCTWFDGPSELRQSQMLCSTSAMQWFPRGCFVKVFTLCVEYTHFSLQSEKHKGNVFFLQPQRREFCFFLSDYKERLKESEPSPDRGIAWSPLLSRWYWL